MIRLYTDDIEDTPRYSDQDILNDVRDLIHSGQRENSILDYKLDVSDKDNWAATVGAFANTFGGLIIFGVEGKGDQPRKLTGYDPQGIEIRTRLTSTLLSRIQPRPDFQVRVVTLDEDATREVAIVRVREGLDSPYMYSKDHAHRVYIRVDSQKAEADYLQLSALLNKRDSHPTSTVTQIGHFVNPGLRVMRPINSNSHSPDWYRFILIPLNTRVARRLTEEVEAEFGSCIEATFGEFTPQALTRTFAATYHCRLLQNQNEHRLGLSAEGWLGFSAHACLQLKQGMQFICVDFGRDLVDFLCLATLFYGSARYYGQLNLNVALSIPNMGAQTASVSGGDIFRPILRTLHGTLEMSHPITLSTVDERSLVRYTTAVVNDLGRHGGCVLETAKFTRLIQPIVRASLDRMRSQG